MITLGVLLYETSRSYYYEQNMHRYAMYETLNDLVDSMGAIALKVHLDKSALNNIITNSDVVDAADRMTYMDPQNAAIWSNVSLANQGLRTMAFNHYFPGGYQTAPPDQVYQYILSLNSALLSAPGKEGMSASPDLYGQNDNILTLNETALQNAGHISGELIQWIEYYLGHGIV
jgi:hypothetical protein